MARTYSRREALRLTTGIGMLAAGGWAGIACGSGDGRATATPAAVSTRAVPRSTDRSERLRLGVLRSPSAPTQPLSRLERMLAYSRLIAVDPRTALIHADLATGFEVSDSLEVRFTLRPDVFLHPDLKGLSAPVTAELIQRNLEKRVAEEGSLFAEVIDQIETPDPSTLVLRLRAPFSLLFELLASSDASIRGETRYASFTEAVGSGPFVPAGQDSTGNALLANPRYHDPDYPRIEQVNVLHFAEERDIDGAYLASQLDVRQHPTTTSWNRVSERPGTQQTSRAARTLRGLGLSLLPNKGGVPTAYVEAFQDERVRRAISLGVDRGALAELDTLGRSQVASPVGAAHGADSLPLAELLAHPLYQYRPDEAAKLLAAATTEPVTFRVLASEAAGPRHNGDLLVSQLRDVGFDAQLRVTDPARWEAAFFAGNFEACLFDLSGLDTPDIGLRLHTTGGLDGRFSLWGYSNPVFDAAVKAALSELVPIRRAVAIRQAQRVLLEEAPGMFPLVTPTEFASMGSRVIGYEFDAFDFNPGWLAAQWERPT